MLLNKETFSGTILLIALGFILIIANTPLNSHYQTILNFPLANKSLLFWINDGLMAFFFLLLALEIKREILIGELRHPAQVMLPIAAACGGVIVPALIYFIIAGHHSAELARGWAIPVATDVALALGLLSLLGKRVPVGLKIFLAVLAIADDLIAIIIIGFFYTEHVVYGYLLLALAGVAILILLNFLGVTKLIVYLLLGLLIWLAVLKSGIHPTLAGVMVGFCIPFLSLRKLEQILKPWVSFLILPLFVLANAGVPIVQYQLTDLLQPLPVGIALGLFFGKQIGIFLAAGLLIKLGFARLPSQSTWGQLYGVAILAGIGFTMSLFISNLAFLGTSLDMLSRVGILAGSFCSAIIGLGVLYFNKKSGN